MGSEHLGGRGCGQSSLRGFPLSLFVSLYEHMDAALGGAMPVLTLTGSAQRLSDLIGAKTVRALTFQGGAANSNPIYLTTGSATLTSSDYDVRLPAASGGVPAAPFMVGDQVQDTIHTEQFWVLGTNTEKLHVLVL